MRRAVQKVIADPLSEELLKGRFKDMQKVKVILEGETTVFVDAEEVEESVPILSGAD
jgi:ATP-dependent Clp protease ATP-binding subunit ClpC